MTDNSLVDRTIEGAWKRPGKCSEVLRGAWKWLELRIKGGETDCFEWVQPKLGRIVPPKVGINALYQQPIRTAPNTVILGFDPLQTAKTAVYRPF
jgi:hypothetical protein